MTKLENQFYIQSELKPNWKVYHVLNEVDLKTKEMSKNDFLVVLVGTNDI